MRVNARVLQAEAGKFNPEGYLAGVLALAG